MVAGVPGLHAACIPWLHEHEVALIMCDAVTDATPSTVPGISLPVHSVGIVGMGLWLLDNAALEELAAVCAELQQIECCLIVSPLQLVGGTGSPVNPLALL
jgi:kynurenine formamidase